MSQSVAISGATSPSDASVVFVTYTQPHFDAGGIYPNPMQSQDIIPSFMYFMGSVAYEKDSQGNMVARNKSGGEAP